MALVRPGGVAGLVSGGLGGVVFRQGRCGSVVSMRPIKRVTMPARVRDPHAVMAWALARWDLLTWQERRAWEGIAQSYRSVNRLGVGRLLSARALYLKFWIPRAWGSGADQGALPDGLTCASPFSVAIDFTAGGPYNVLSEGDWAPDVYEGIRVQRRLQYGNRPGPDSLVTSYGILKDADVVDHYAAVKYCGFELEGGEQVRVWARWHRGYSWRSQWVSATGTVAA